MNITIYGRPACSGCNAAKAFLDSRGWEYTYTDMFSDLDPHDAQAVLDRSGMRSVPIIEIDGNIVGGLDHMIDYIHSTERNNAE